MFTTIISTKKLNEHLNNEDWLVVDCRSFLGKGEKGRQDYLQSHIPNAVHAHLDNDLSGEIIRGKTGRHPLPSKTDTVELFSKLGINQNTQVIAYDQGHGGIAARLWWMLNWLGHEKVAVLDGGWAKWQIDNLAVNSDIPQIKPSHFQVSASNFDFVNADFIESNQNNKDLQLIDSRTAPRYRGEHEPIDPIAGHIPNAINLPFLDNLHDGVFLSKEDLKKRFEAIFKNHTTAQTIFYCGSGVTACHNILAIKHAGFGVASLYSGSWSDWITDSNRPIE